MDSVTVVLEKSKWVTLEGAWARAWKDHHYAMWDAYQLQKIRDQLGERSRG